MYIDKLDEIVNRYNNIYPIIKRKPFDVNLNTYISSGKEIDDEDPKFKVGNHVRTSKYKVFLQKPIFQIGLKKFLSLKNLKTLLWTYVISDLKGENIVGTFYKKEFQ